MIPRQLHLINTEGIAISIDGTSHIFIFILIFSNLADTFIQSDL